MKRVVHSQKAASAAFGVFMLAADWSKPQVLEMRRYRSPKTTAQCALLHVLWRQIAVHVGRCEDEIKDIFKSQYGPEEVRETPDGEHVRVVKSVSKYTHDEASRMIEQTYRKAAEWGVELEDAA